MIDIVYVEWIFVVREDFYEQKSGMVGGFAREILFN